MPLVEASKLQLPISNRCLVVLQNLFKVMQDSCNKEAKKCIKIAKDGSQKEQNAIKQQFIDSEIIQNTEEAIAFFVENKFVPDAVNRMRDFQLWKDRILDLINMAKSFKKMHSIEQQIFECKTQLQMAVMEKDFAQIVSLIIRIKLEIAKIRQLKISNDVE